MATAQATTDHDTIREWVESRGGHPSRVKRTGNRKDPGVLRIDFPGFSGEDTLEEIEWDEFFEWFDRDKLALLLSDEEGNRFNKFVSRATARKAASSKKSSSGRGAKSSRSKKASSSKKAAGSTKKASGSSKKAAGSTKKASSSKKAAGSTKKASGSTKKASTSTKKASTSTKKASSAKKTTKKASTSTKKASTPRRLVASKAPSKKTTTKKTSKKAAGSSSNTTTDHDEIRNWVEARGGFPAHVRQTGRKRGDLGVLRIDYPGYSGKDTLERIDWEDWFEAFDRNKLAFLYQDKRNSRFSKLVNR